MLRKSATFFQRSLMSTPDDRVDSQSGVDREDRKCANIIKGVHAELRLQAQNDSANVEQIWDRHVEKGQLTVYSEAMRTLATEHWEETSGSSRISWVKEHVVKFLFEGDRHKFVNKIARFGPNRDNEPEVSLEAEPKYFLVDVGSCYNPFAEQFKSEPRMDVTAIDLQPPQQLVHPVYKCDFYRVPVGSHQVTTKDGAVKSLGSCSFHVVVFCLLLEYLPLPKMRHDVCQKAWDVLKDWGVLLIVTPDSSHQAKNELQMKCWRLALIKMGFVRIYIEKLPHARCLGFIKVPADLHNSLFMQENIEKLQKKLGQNSNWSFPEMDADLMFIPQDETTRQNVLRKETSVSRQEDEMIISESDEKGCADFLAGFATF